MTAFTTLVARDLRIALRDGGAIGIALGFYLIVVAIVPIGLGPDLNLLSRIGPGLLWVALLLSALLSVDRIFHNDHEDGTLEVIALGPLPLELVVAAKALAHWLSTAVPLVALAPVLGLLLNLELGAYPAVVATMLIGSPAVSFLGAVGGALTLGLRRGGLLVAMLILPLFVPVLIFGVASVDRMTSALGSPVQPLLILAAYALATVVLAPFAAAQALRANLA
ncbi:MAG: heme exporter protein CcmB [Hyphomicrobiaceae bacterium]